MFWLRNLLNHGGSFGRNGGQEEIGLFESSGFRQFGVESPVKLIEGNYHVQAYFWYALDVLKKTLTSQRFGHTLVVGVIVMLDLTFLLLVSIGRIDDKFLIAGQMFAFTGGVKTNMPIVGHPVRGVEIKELTTAVSSKLVLNSPTLGIDCAGLLFLHVFCR